MYKCFHQATISALSGPEAPTFNRQCPCRQVELFLVRSGALSNIDRTLCFRMLGSLLGSASKKLFRKSWGSRGVQLENFPRWFFMSRKSPLAKLFEVAGALASRAWRPVHVCHHDGFKNWISHMIGTSCCKQGCGLGRDQTRHWQPGVATNRSSLDLDRHQNSRQITSTAQSAHIS